MADQQTAVNPKLPTGAQVTEQNLNPYGETDFDVQSLMVTPQSGRAPIDQEVKDNYKVKHIKYDSLKGAYEYVHQSVWKLFSVFTSDTRLSNLTKAEVRYARWAVRMEGTCLANGLYKPASTAAFLRISAQESALGRDGFLRNNIQEVRQKTESLVVEQKPQDKKFLGGAFG